MLVKQHVDTKETENFNFYVLILQSINEYLKTAVSDNLKF